MVTLAVDQDKTVVEPVATQAVVPRVALEVIPVVARREEQAATLAADPKEDLEDSAAVMEAGTVEMVVLQDTQAAVPAVEETEVVPVTQAVAPAVVVTVVLPDTPAVVHQETVVLRDMQEVPAMLKKATLAADPADKEDPDIKFSKPTKQYEITNIHIFTTGCVLDSHNCFTFMPWPLTTILIT